MHISSLDDNDDDGFDMMMIMMTLGVADAHFSLMMSHHDKSS